MTLILKNLHNLYHLKYFLGSLRRLLSFEEQLNLFSASYYIVLWLPSHNSYFLNRWYSISKDQEVPLLIHPKIPYVDLLILSYFPRKEKDDYQKQ